MDTPVLFSIVIPTYNRASFILKTVDSFIAQTYPNFELIIVDDGSMDNTDEVVKAITDPRVSYHKKANEERGVARNYGLAIAKGEYVNFFDSDDLAYPNHLQTAKQTIEKFSKPEILHLGHDLKTPTGTLLQTCDSFNGDTESYAVRKKQISINALFVKREIAISLPFSTNRLLSASEDALFLCQLCARYTLYYNNTVTSTIVEHDSRSMVTSTEQQLLNRQRFMIEGLEADDVFIKRYGHTIPDIMREFNYLLCLSCLINKQNDKALTYFKAYIHKKTSALIGKRTLVFIKKYTRNWF